MSSHCSTCNHTITLETAQKVKGPRKYCRWEWNVAAVWGQITTGGGHSQLQETMSVLDVPVITKSSFIWSEHDIGEWWREEGGELADRGEG